MSIEYLKLDVKTKVFWTESDGLEYLTLDFSNLTDFQVLEAILYVSELMKNEEKSSIRIITIVTGMDVGFSTQMTLKKMAKDLQPFIHKSGMVGVEGLLIPFYKIYNKFTGSKAKLFKTQSEAIKYICS